MDFPAVLIDHNGHTAIADRHPNDPDTVRLVRMGQDRLSVFYTVAASVERMGYREVENYPIYQAAEKFLRHKAGVSFAAGQILKELVHLNPEFHERMLGCAPAQNNTPTPAAGIQQQDLTLETTTMTIEQNLERLAAAQEKTAEHLSGILAALLSRNDLLATIGAKLPGEVVAAAPAAETEDKPKRTRRTKEQIAADEAAAAAAKGAPAESTAAGESASVAGAEEPAGTETSASSDDATAQPASAAAENDDSFGDDSFEDAAPPPVVRTKEDVQKLFGRISQTGDENRKAAIAVLRTFGTAEKPIKNLGDLPESSYGEVYAKLEAQFAEKLAA